MDKEAPVLNNSWSYRVAARLHCRKMTSQHIITLHPRRGEGHRKHTYVYNQPQETIIIAILLTFSLIGLKYKLTEDRES
jgi:hypothetical protein